MITGQLAEIGWQDARVMLEPVGRNTAPAVAMAALALSEWLARRAAKRVRGG